MQEAASSSQRPADSPSSIDELFEHMGARQRILLEIINSTKEPKLVGEVNALVERLQESNASVFDAESYCAQLKRAGALELVFEDGSPYEDVVLDPEVVIIDGEKYLQPTRKADAYWVATEHGLEAARRRDPHSSSLGLIAAEPQYAHIYRRILELCEGDGCQIAQISAFVDDDPAAQSPRRLASRFTDSLERAGAIVWGGSWRVTEAGRAALAALNLDGGEQ